MKQIQPVSTWYNGEIVQATIFNLTCSSDNLVDIATFYYQLYSITNILLVEGNIKMIGFDYHAYNTSPDANEYAYQWAATQLNLTLI